MPHSSGGHYGGDDRMRNMIFKPGIADPLGQRAGARAGALSVLCGIAALQSAQSGKVVRLADLMPDLFEAPSAPRIAAQSSASGGRR